MTQKCNSKTKARQTFRSYLQWSFEYLITKQLDIQFLNGRWFKYQHYKHGLRVVSTFLFQFLSNNLSSRPVSGIWMVNYVSLSNTGLVWYSDDDSIFEAMICIKCKMTCSFYTQCVPNVDIEIVVTGHQETSGLWESHRGHTADDVVVWVLSQFLQKTWVV